MALCKHGRIIVRPGSFPFETSSVPILGLPWSWYTLISFMRATLLHLARILKDFCALYIIPTPILDYVHVQPYFDGNVCMAYASVNTFHAHPLTAYNIYYNKFIAAYGIFKSYFEGKTLTNQRATMRILQAFFVQRLQPR